MVGVAAELGLLGSLILPRAVRMFREIATAIKPRLIEIMGAELPRWSKILLPHNT